MSTPPKGFIRMEGHAPTIGRFTGNPHIVHPNGGFCECGMYISKEKLG